MNTARRPAIQAIAPPSEDGVPGLRDRERAAFAVNETGLTFEPVEHGGMCPDTMPQAVILRDAEGRSATYVPEEEPLENRPQDLLGTGEGLTFETLAHGGEYPDDMPQALKVSDPAGNTCIYVPIKENGRVVDSKGFELVPDT